MKRVPFKARGMKRAWLLALPLLLRNHTLPLLLDRLTPAARAKRVPGARGLKQTVKLVSRVSLLRLFELPLFPRACLRRSLALYSVLSRMGYPVEIHFGVRKNGPDLHGHSWVTLDGAPLGEKASGDIYRTIYAYPSDSHSLASAEIGAFAAFELS